MMRYFLFSIKLAFYILFYSILYLWIGYLLFGIQSWQIQLTWAFSMLLLSYTVIPFLLLDFLKASNLKSRKIVDSISACTLRVGSENVDVLISKKYVNMIFYLPKFFGRGRLIVGSNLTSPPSPALLNLINDFFSKSMNFVSLEKLLPFYFGAPFLFSYILLEKTESELLQWNGNKLLMKAIFIIILISKFLLRPTLGPFYSNELASMSYIESPQSKDLVEMMLDELKGINSNNEIIRRMMPI